MNNEQAIAIQNFGQKPTILRPGTQLSMAYRARIFAAAMIKRPRIAQLQLSKMRPPAIKSKDMTQTIMVTSHSETVAKASVPKSLIWTCSGAIFDATHRISPVMKRFKIRLIFITPYIVDEALLDYSISCAKCQYMI